MEWWEDPDLVTVVETQTRNLIGRDWPVLEAMDAALKFWRIVDRRLDENSCWGWLLSARVSDFPRGIFSVKAFSMLPGDQMYAHVASRYMTHGDVVPGMKVLHRCDVPDCVRPDHLWIGTMSDNSRDMVNKGRHRSQRYPEQARELAARARAARQLRR